MVVGKVPQRKQFTWQTGGVKDTISFLLFLVIYVLLIQTILCLRGSLGSQAERVARERRRPSVPDVGNTTVGTTHGVL